MDLRRIINQQNQLSKNVISKNILPQKIRTVCGVDVSYKGNKAFCSAVIINTESFEILEIKNFTCTVSSPYIPGFFMLREAKPILSTVKKLKNSFDVLLVDGHGRLHPRNCGLACYVGLKLNKPVIGVAKKLLCGKIRSDSKIELDRKVIGIQIKNKKPIFVSIGHKINLSTAKKIVQDLTLDNYWYPEPLRLADANSKALRRI